MKAQGADAKYDAANKFLVLADTTLFFEIEEPKEELERGIQLIRDVRACSSTCRRIPLRALQQLLAFSGLACPYHAEQGSLAEYCAYKAGGVLAHIDLAAEAKARPNVKKPQAADSDEDAGSDDGDDRRPRPPWISRMKGAASTTRLLMTSAMYPCRSSPRTPYTITVKPSP